MTANGAERMSMSKSRASGFGPISDLSPARSVGRRGVVESVKWPTFRSGQCIEQRLRLGQVGRIKPLGEPAVNGREYRARFSTPALIPPQPRQTHRRAQFPTFRQLLLRQGNRQAEVTFGKLVLILLAPHFTAQPHRLGPPTAFVGHEGKRLVDAPHGIVKRAAQGLNLCQTRQTYGDKGRRAVLATDRERIASKLQPFIDASEVRQRPALLAFRPQAYFVKSELVAQGDGSAGHDCRLLRL